MTVNDVNNFTYEWAQIIYDKLEKDKEDEAKRREEENAKQEEEYKNQQQLMANQYNFGNMPNFNMLND
ncbi:MAG: hypothetical protein [Wendovervirus sonii]|uniref:Uncharacterized protein n=1 Tax=phage Lak_Megaphage_Sonny TaxID=3109229 RepID=A0ABZ0Z6Q8_9CAUD|nr:MAG: hypothetical protein [phage Lak_Megaphage_Sonny]